MKIVGGLNAKRHSTPCEIVSPNTIVILFHVYLQMPITLYYINTKPNDINNSNKHTVSPISNRSITSITISYTRIRFRNKHLNHWHDICCCW